MSGNKAEEAVRHIRALTQASPVIGIILGSGLGSFVDKVSPGLRLPYPSIPNFPAITVKGHGGNLVLGAIAGVPIAVMEGRFHFYEGRTMAEVVFPVEVLHGLGVKALVVTNASGGIRDDLGPGDLMLITDHINLLGTNPLIGRKGGSERFVDMTGAYDGAFIDVALHAAKRQGTALKKGVLAALTGPSYETPAEVMMLRTLGADAVCMSTVPEVIMARLLGLKVLGLSLIANSAAGLTEKGVTHEEVLGVAASRQEDFARLLEGFIQDANKLL